MWCVAEGVEGDLCMNMRVAGAREKTDARGESWVEAFFSLGSGARWGESSMTSSPERFFPSAAPGPVLLFDGECGLCQRLVRGLLRLDREGRLRFAPLQGSAAQAYLRAVGLPMADVDSLVFVPDWARREGSTPVALGERWPRRESEPAVYLLRTDGAIAALRVIGGVASVLAGGLAVWPARWREAGYRLGARWRYRLFGEWRPRPLARAEWAARFLA